MVMDHILAFIDKDASKNGLKPITEKSHLEHFHR